VRRSPSAGLARALALDNARAEILQMRSMLICSDAAVVARCRGGRAHRLTVTGRRSALIRIRMHISVLWYGIVHSYSPTSDSPFRPREEKP
jgi:hypothetical protein